MSEYGPYFTLYNIVTMMTRALNEVKLCENRYVLEN